MSIYHIHDFKFSYPFSSQQINLNGTFTVEAGECILLQGVSGSGKSTLLAALKGLIPHLIAGNLSGEIKFHGREVTELTEQDLLKIGYLQQNPDSQYQLKQPFVHSTPQYFLSRSSFFQRSSYFHLKRISCLLVFPQHHV